MAVIEIEGLRKEYRRLRRGSTLAVDGLDMSVPEGGVFGFLGPNGSGKTTTIRCLVGLIRPSAGRARLLGAEGHGAVPDPHDPAADEAYDGLGATWDLSARVYGRNSIDDHSLPLVGVVHYGVDYDNAFWDGHRMVFGDGDGTLFNRFTAALEVIGHELTHGVIGAELGLDYMGQSGALNESISDVFGALVKQHHLGQRAEEADWLIGAGLLRSSVQGVALRSMKAPGTAYDDPVLGQDPQPAHMDGYVTTNADNGGVHTNSGIPNHAFYLLASALGGHAWERAGWIWYDALHDARVRPGAHFATFAQATVRSAMHRFGAGTEEVRAVVAAWDRVGVEA
jgi:Zn-dependent metalloprotease